MADLLVRLYDFQPQDALMQKLQQDGFTIRRAMAPEKSIVTSWVLQNFEQCWADECDVAFSRDPISCFIAVKDGALAGFACCETTCKDFFGPTGVSEDMRGYGLGKALLQVALLDLRNRGYGYAIIGDAGPVDFYKRFCGATVIEDSAPGVYRGMLHG